MSTLQPQNLKCQLYSHKTLNVNSTAYARHPWQPMTLDPKAFTARICCFTTESNGHGARYRRTRVVCNARY
eukprot:2965547-Rhodomonas_salina.1